MKHVVCFSRGHSSAVALVEVARLFGKENTIAVNHNIHESVEDADIKRFGDEVADYVGLPITYANMPGWDTMDQFDTVTKAQAFKVGTGTALCTARMKTEPFAAWLAENFPVTQGEESGCVIYYGFDANEPARIQRRIGALASMGYRSDYPLALWKSRTIRTTREIGIEPPLTYSVFKHGNCKGCLKAGMQHWYVIYCLFPAIWAKAKHAEDVIGHTITKGVYLEELEARFEIMKRKGVPATEHIPFAEFWAGVEKIMPQTRKGQLRMFVPDQSDMKPCECVF